MLAQAESLLFKANRSHSQYKLESIDFDDFAYNLNKTIYNYQKSHEGKHTDKLAKFRRVNSFKDIVVQEKDQKIFQTFSRCAPGFDETETKELMELILQLEYLFIFYHKFYPDQSNPNLLYTYLNCLAYNKEKFFDNYNAEISEQLQMSILRNSQQRIIDEKTDENLVKFLVNEINRRNKYSKNVPLIRNDLSKYQKIQDNYEQQKRKQQIEHSDCNLLVASLKIIFKNNDNEFVTARFPLVDKNRQMCLDFEKLLKQGDAHELFRQWNEYLDLARSSAEITLLISIVQDLYQEKSWIVNQILEQTIGVQIIQIERIILQIGTVRQFCTQSLDILNHSHKEIAHLIQSKLSNSLSTLNMKPGLRIEKQIMLMSNSEEELSKEDERHCLENCLFELTNLKMCLIPQGLMSQLFYIHRYCSDGTTHEQMQYESPQKDSPLRVDDAKSPSLHQNQHKKQQFMRQCSRRTSLISFGYSEMNAEQSHFEPLQQKISDMRLNQTVFIDCADKKEWKPLINKIKQEKHLFKESLDSSSFSSSSSFSTTHQNEDKFMKQLKNFLQNQQMRK